MNAAFSFAYSMMLAETSIQRTAPFAVLKAHSYSITRPRAERSPTNRSRSSARTQKSRACAPTASSMVTSNVRQARSFTNRTRPVASEVTTTGYSAFSTSSRYRPSLSRKASSERLRTIMVHRPDMSRVSCRTSRSSYSTGLLPTPATMTIRSPSKIGTFMCLITDT